MQINISGQNVDITPALKKHIEHRLLKLQNHFEQLPEVHIILRIEKIRHLAEATIAVNGNKLFAQANSDDMYATIDLLGHKLDRQVLKYKEKLKSHHNKEVKHHIPNH